MSWIEDRINEMAKEVATSQGLALEEVRLMRKGKKMLLRVTIDKPGGVTLDDCERMSRELEALMDVEDPIKGTYTLEVSSPGLDRPIRKPEDFRKHIGKLIRLVTLKKIDNQSFFIGRILSVGEDSLSLIVAEKQVTIPFDDISSARLEVEL
ncbi:MAG: ribosome maturation factor RimP [Nitrospirae bacterium]|nr:ribosome maturation factor RimP [Nitrospirota bacterium]